MMNYHQVGIQVKPQDAKDVLAITAGGDMLVIQQLEAHRAARVLFQVASLENAEGLSEPLWQGWR